MTVILEKVLVVFGGPLARCFGLRPLSLRRSLIHRARRVCVRVGKNRRETMRAKPRANHYEISMLANIRRLVRACQRAPARDRGVFTRSGIFPTVSVTAGMDCLIPTVAPRGGRFMSRYAHFAPSGAFAATRKRSSAAVQHHPAEPLGQLRMRGQILPDGRCRLRVNAGRSVRHPSSVWGKRYRRSAGSRATAQRRPHEAARMGFARSVWRVCWRRARWRGSRECRGQARGARRRQWR